LLSSRRDVVPRRDSRFFEEDAVVKFGMFGINLGVCSTADAVARVAVAAERAGFDSLWTGEHVVLPDPHVPPSPVPPDFPFLDPAVALAFAAAHTSRILLATGVVILPQRNPLVLAKELASVDVLSGGRLVFGIGVGYLEPEFRALGVPFDRKGARTNEYIEAIRALWTEPSPAYAGRFVGFAGIQAMPRPLRRPYPPFVLGGTSAPSLARAVRYGNGWYGFNLDRDQTRACLEGLRAAAATTRRPGSLGKLEITITPPPGAILDAASIAAYRELGVDRLVPYPMMGSADQLVDWLGEAGVRMVESAR
jgi:probable F420-dependent oxidoreductase